LIKTISSLCASWLLVFSFSLHAEDLLEIYQLAESTNPTLKASWAHYQAASAIQDQTTALLLPTVQMQIKSTKNHLSSELANPSQAFGSSLTNINDDFIQNDLIFSINQPIYHHDFFLKKQQSLENLRHTSTLYQAEKQALMTAVAKHYFSILKSLDNLELSKIEQQATQQQLERTRKHYEAGELTATDVAEAQSRYDLVSAQLIAAENQLMIAQETLRELTGELHTEFQKLGKHMWLQPPNPEDIDHWMEMALLKNMKLRALQHMLMASQKNTQQQFSAHYPTFDLAFQWLKSSDDRKVSSPIPVSDDAPKDTQKLLELIGLDISGNALANGTDSTSYSVGIQINVPIYQGGMVQAKYREALHKENKLKNELEQQRRKVSSLARQAYLGLMSSISQEKALKQAVISSKAALEGIEAGLTLGSRTVIDVLTAQQEFYRAQRDHSRKRYDYLLNQLQLKQASGELTLDDINTTNELLIEFIDIPELSL